MGSPLDLVLANIFVVFYESLLFENIVNLTCIKVMMMTASPILIPSTMLKPFLPNFIPFSQQFNMEVKNGCTLLFWTYWLTQM